MSLYSPLSRQRDEIRIIKDIRVIDGQVRCKLEPISLQDSPNFKAISWCWGEKSYQTDITVNDEALEVRENAIDILKWLHARGEDSVWLDAICINQQDLDERSHQVTLMRDIYTKAAGTLVILELDVDEKLSTDAKVAIDTVMQQAREQTDNLQNFVPIVSDQAGIHLHTDDALPDLDWDAICSFFASSWFTRMWVFQEIMLSNNAICCYGSQMIPWSDVKVTARWLQFKSYWKYLIRNPGTVGIDNCSLMERSARRQPQKDTWWHLMGLARMFKSTDPRDKVYGLLGLRVLHDRSKPIKPDYRCSVEDLYIEVTRGLIEEHDSLHQILDAQSLDPLEGAYVGDFPSWVPRYDYWFVRSGTSFRRVPMDFQRGAANLLKAKLHPSDPHILAVDGIIVDTVSAVSPILTETLLKDLRRFIVVMLEIWQLSEDARSIRPQNLELILMDVLTTGNLTAQSNLDQSSLLKQFGGFLGALGLGDAEENFEDFHAYHNSFWLWSVNRTFCTTQGGYIAMGPRETQPGDQLVILFGSRIPFILRACEEMQHILIGDTFVPGIMQGEHVTSLQAKNKLSEHTVRFDIK